MIYDTGFNYTIANLDTATFQKPKNSVTQGPPALPAHFDPKNRKFDIQHHYWYTC